MNKTSYWPLIGNNSGSSCSLGNKNKQTSIQREKMSDGNGGAPPPSSSSTSSTLSTTSSSHSALPVHSLEDQFVLRLPPALSEKMRKLVQANKFDRDSVEFTFNGTTKITNHFFFPDASMLTAGV